MATKKDPPKWTDEKVHEPADEDQHGADAGDAESSSAKDVVASPKSPRRKKDKANRRPLSAYNLFFKDERTRILKEIEEDRAGPDYIANAEAALKRVKNGSKAAAKFQAIASTIAGRWKALTAEERKPYEELAVEEMERYKERKDEFHRNLVRECEMAGRAALNKKSSYPEEDAKPRPALREDPNALGHSPFSGSEAMLPTSRLPLPAMMHLGPRTSLPLHTTRTPFGLAGLNQTPSDPNVSLPLARQGSMAGASLHANPFGHPALNQAPSPNRQDDSLPLALMMRQVEVEQEIVRLQDMVGQLRQQRESMLSPGAPRALPQDWTRGQADAMAMQMQQAQALRDFPRSATAPTLPLTRSQQGRPFTSDMSMPDLLALAHSLQQRDSASQSDQSNPSNQANANPNWRPFFG